jgi:serine phosphatase RsbU (regulator of sigma subunit)/anti-sigma regulatory factor (Ser/Thr protein kinase)
MHRLVDTDVDLEALEPSDAGPRSAAGAGTQPGADGGGQDGADRARQEGADGEDSDRRLEQLESVADAALAYMSLEQMLYELLDRIRGALNVDTAAVLLLDEDRNVLVARAARGIEEEVREGVRVPLARGFAGRVAAEVRPIIIEDLDHAEVVNPILRQKGIRSMLGVPLHVEGRVIGVMHIGTLERRLFDAEDVKLLQFAADRATLAIDNARLLEQRAATEIMQRALLPDALPNLPGVRFSAKYLPAGSEMRIGGDWYDVFPLPRSRLALVIGDVVGHGVLAASVMAEVRTALRAYLHEGHALPHVMALLNDLLVSMGRRRSATAAILELDLETNELEAVSAGHPPPLMVTPQGEPCFLSQPQGLPLGFRAATQYVSERYEFPAGSRLILYSDGLVERRGESIDEGLCRLSSAAQRAATDSGSAFADRVYRLLAGDFLSDDDIALLAIEAVPQPSSIELPFAASPDVLRDLRGMLRRWLVVQGVGEQEVFDVCLAASEAASNAIEHAYGAREASFTMSCGRDEGNVLVSIRDGGRWREQSPYGRGRGLSIMRALVDSVEVKSDGNGTVVTLTKRAPGATP